MERIRLGGNKKMNQTIFFSIFKFAHRSVLLDDIGVFFAEYLIYFLALGFLFLVFAEPTWRRRLAFLLEGGLAMLLGRGIVTEVIRFFYHHPRPFDALANVVPLISESGNSFPSGHMMFLVPLAVVIYAWNKRWGIWYLVLSVIMGIARIFVGVHWPLDILGGLVLGILCGWAVHALLTPAIRKLKEGSVEVHPSA